MSKKKSPFKTNFLPRSLTASIAGIRAGSVLAIDSALHKTILTGNNNAHSPFAKREAERFVQELGKLKGSYVKIGQMMAIFGEHFLPTVLTQALHTLGNNAEPLAWESLEPNVRKSLGKRFKQLDIQPEAIAAASLAQVHTAIIKSSGEKICLKIQYPNLSEVIDSDFDTVVRMLLLARWLTKGQELDEWLNTMRNHLHNEINYEREVTLTQKIKTLLEESNDSNNFVNLRVPEIHSDYCSESIIAMEYMEGKPLTDITIKKLSLARRNNLSKAMLDLFFKEVYSWGLVQTDPNFGNFLIHLNDSTQSNSSNQPNTKDTLVLLDFGSMMELPEHSLIHLRNIISGSQFQEQETITQGLLGLGWLKKDASDAAKQMFSEFCMHLLEPLLPTSKLPENYLNDKGAYRWSHSELLQRAGKKGVRHAASRHFSPPASDFVMLARKLTGVFTFISVLEAEFNGYDIIKQYVDNKAG